MIYFMLGTDVVSKLVCVDEVLLSLDRFSAYASTHNCTLVATD